MTKLLFFMEKDAVFKLEKDISSLHMVTYRRHFERLQMSSSTQFTWLKIQSEIFRLADSFRSFFLCFKRTINYTWFYWFFFTNFHVFNIKRIIFSRFTSVLIPFFWVENVRIIFGWYSREHLDFFRSSNVSVLA